MRGRDAPGGLAGLVQCERELSRSPRPTSTPPHDSDFILDTPNLAAQAAAACPPPLSPPFFYAPNHPLPGPCHPGPPRHYYSAPPPPPPTTSSWLLAAAPTWAPQVTQLGDRPGLAQSGPVSPARPEGRRRRKGGKSISPGASPMTRIWPVTRKWRVTRVCRMTRMWQTNAM